MIVGAIVTNSVSYDDDRDILIQINGSATGYRSYSIAGGSQYHSDNEPETRGFVIQRKGAGGATALTIGEYFLSERSGVVFGHGNIGGVAQNYLWEQVSSSTGIKAGVSNVTTIKVIPATLTGQSQKYFVGGSCNVGYR